MKFKQCKQELIDLGFGDSYDLVEYKDIVLSSINRAMKEINYDFPIKDIYTFEQTGDEEGLETLDLLELTKGTYRGEEEYVFNTLIDVPIRIVDNKITKFNNYLFEIDRYLRIDKAIKGQFSFYYTRRTREVDISTDDNEYLTINYKAEKMLPLLASYYLWLDDDETKATQYFNQYQDIKSSLLSAVITPKATIGGISDEIIHTY